MAAAAATNPAAIPSTVASGAMPRPGIDSKQDDDNDRRIIFCQCGIPLHWKSFHEGMADSDFELGGGCGGSRRLPQPELPFPSMALAVVHHDWGIGRNL